MEIKLINDAQRQADLQKKIEDRFEEAWDVEKHLVKKKDKRSMLLSQGWQEMNDVGANGKSIPSPQYQTFNHNFTALGQYTTAIAETVFNQPMAMAVDEDPIISRIRGEFQDAQRVFFNIRDAQAGLARGGTYGSPVETVPTTGRNVMAAQTGFFGSKVPLNIDDLTLFRNTDTLDGTYAAEAMRRAISKVAIEMYQRQRLVVARTIVNNQYTYYTNADGTQEDVLIYGRLSQNNYFSSRPWQQINKKTGKVTDNVQNAQPLYDLLDWFTNPDNTIIRNTLPFLKGLAMNPATARILTKVALNNDNPLSATSFMASFTEQSYGAESVITSNIPALKDVDIYVYEGMVNVGVDVPTGTIDKKEYILPTGVIIPIIDYEQVGMGTMMFTPEPRGAWLHGASQLPNNALGVSDPRAAYMRVTSSLQDPQAQSPYWEVEAGARYVYVNPIAAGVSYVLYVGEWVDSEEEGTISRNEQAEGIPIT
jgi:hypothetical protein